VNRTLENKIALGTGGSGAIGSAIIAGLDQQGACAVSLDVASPPTAPFLACDVRDDGSVAAPIAKVREITGALIWSCTRQECPVKQLYGSSLSRIGILCRT